jgi:hypothetical protein
MSERRKIIQQLHERISKIDQEIDKLIQDRYLQTCMTRELLKKKSEEESDDSEQEGSVSDLSIKVIRPENISFKPESEKKKAMTKAQEREEERAKARAWHINRDRVRDKEKTRKQK